MTKYKLKKRYPTLPNDLKEGDVLIKTDDGYLKEIPNTHYLSSWSISKSEVEQNPEFWEKVEEKDYEILSFKSKNSGQVVGRLISDQEYFIKSNQWEIYSVKRLSDGEVFTVGDKVQIATRDDSQTIKQFEIDEGSIRFRFTDGCGALLKYFPNPEDIKHAKEPLFTTEDGVDIYEGDKFYIVDYKWYIVSSHGGNYNLPSGKRFSTKEKAKEYIGPHKPIYSKKDIEKALELSRQTWSNFLREWAVSVRHFKKNLDD